MVPENVEVLKIVKMLDTLVLGKILQQDAAGEYVSTTETELLFRKINVTDCALHGFNFLNTYIWSPAFFRDSEKIHSIGTYWV